MKKIIIVCSLFVLCANLYAQKDSFDIIAFNLPEGWKKEMKASVASLDYIDKKDKSWCHIGVYKSVPSKGSIDADFESDWKEFMAGYFKITDSPQTTEVQEAEGWKVKVGVGKFKYNKKDAAAMLTTFTGFGRSVSIVTSTGSERYLETLQNFISSIELKRPDENDVVVNQQQMPSADNSGFAFHTTNFNDGWTSVIKNDWVEVTKGEIKVRLFYAIPYDYNLFTGTGVRQRDYY